MCIRDSDSLNRTPLSITSNAASTFRDTLGATFLIRENTRFDLLIILAIGVPPLLMSKSGGRSPLGNTIPSAPYPR